ncbi:hypothetical protein [Arthrobacter sp. VKM Ac-2550]|nr:hypothetical protein [Arthrobacter sp. VKM Ac-2550]
MRIATIAVLTNTIKRSAGSTVLNLHNPIRVDEDFDSLDLA